MKSFLFAIFLIASYALPVSVKAENTTEFQTFPAPRPSATPCWTAETLKAEQLYGAWRARFTNPPAGFPAEATVQLKQHEEFSESLAGVVSREKRKAELAGDLQDGLLLLDESSDSVSITGTWNGELVKASCGTVFKGVWKDTSNSAAANAPDVPFTLTRRP